ncbi:hypothetical protein [Puerhibacterium puerhi]|uniref:hypothetical protein n=1 Tax=Puerhibacterium puerhi TaxID=2692623 RepID=UPI00135B5373|nr:hypothetical protein [Puerhibacterium puerhi]
MKYLIKIDDHDVEETPSVPWTANIYYDGDPTPISVGFGNSPGSAVRDAMREVDW